MDAEDLLLRQFLGIRRRTRHGARPLDPLRQQREDGTWANFRGGPADLSTTIEAYVALRLAGDPPDAAHMARAPAFVLDRRGHRTGRVFTQMWLALFGAWPWDDLPALPPEVMFLPPWFPLNVYDFACWARQTIVPLTVVGAHRPVRPLGFTPQELRSGAPEPPTRPWSSWGGRFQRFDRALRCVRAAPLPATAPARPAPGDRVDPAPPGGGRKLGRDPAAVGLFADRPAPAWAIRWITR